MSKKLPVTKRLWVAVDGSIYVAEPDMVYFEFAEKFLPIQRAIAFNVGQALALHIVETHNEHVKWQMGIR